MLNIPKFYIKLVILTLSMLNYVKLGWTYCECQHVNGKTRGAHTLHKARRYITSKNHMCNRSGNLDI